MRHLAVLILGVIVVALAISGSFPAPVPADAHTLTSRRIVVQHDGKRQVVRPPGDGGRQMTLSPDRTSLIYQRSETARLTVLDLKSGQVTGELSPLELYGGEVSSTGVLAGLTAHSPGEPNKLSLPNQDF